ncbi:RNA polymerase subunit sigma-24 [Oceaniferula spumae]|uniref:RNA polymerase subunit sigma-24 n=1 Tax=Oceaniferula spumae TaxID=2979115 RepID=A0AAT9FHN0_9BACT
MRGAYDNAQFNTTQWTLVGRMCGGSEAEARDALDVICSNYWPPLYAFSRRKGLAEEDAKDLVQGFFAALLSGEWLKSVDAKKGKLRTFLLTMLERYMSSEWRKHYAAKRGSGKQLISFENCQQEIWLPEDGNNVSSEAWYDRQWALLMISRCFDKLRSQYAERGLVEKFDGLKSFLEWNDDSQSQDDYGNIADQLGMSAGAVKVAVFRLRQQFRKILVTEVTETLPTKDPDDVQQELRYLLSAIGNEMN